MSTAPKRTAPAVDDGPQLRLVTSDERIRVDVPATPRRPRPRPQRAVGSVSGREWSWATRFKVAGAVAGGLGVVFAGGLVFGTSEMGAALGWWILGAIGVAGLAVLAVIVLASPGESPVATVRGKIIG